jgi:hypothetical protein
MGVCIVCVCVIVHWQGITSSNDGHWAENFFRRHLEWWSEPWHMAQWDDATLIGRDFGLGDAIRPLISNIFDLIFK